jgi:hypothetical protein
MDAGPEHASYIGLLASVDVTGARNALALRVPDPWPTLVAGRGSGTALLHSVI